MKLNEFKLVDDERYNEATLDRIREFNRTETDYPRDKTIHALFSERASATPDAVALRDGGVSLTYRELDQRSNQLARLLLNTGIEAESLAGVMFAQTSQLLVAVLGVLKAGGAYLPINHEFPAERIRFELDDAHAPVLISEKRFMRTLNQLQWDCRSVRQLIVLDSRDVHAETEEGGEMMRQQLWDAVADETFDDISGGGWRSSYTGEWLSREVMDDYADNIADKLGPYLSAHPRILEIGCASGISLFRLAPQAGDYCGTDLSPRILQWLRGEVEQRGLGNIRLEHLAAHEIDKLGETPFDIVILNSVIQCFRGHNYLRDVLRKSLDLLKHDGLIFLGNIWDNDRKDEFIESLHKFKAENSGRGFRTKINRSEELFLSADFLADLPHDFAEIRQVECSRSRGHVKSELSEYGFDALVRVNKLHRSKPPNPRTKQQLDCRHVDTFPVDSLDNQATALSPAYLMYTSGTLGRPKGVTIPHRAVVRLVANTTFLQLGPDDRVLQTASIAFDASTFEIWAPLLNGGRLCSMPEKAILDPAEIGRHARDLGITTMWLTASLFNQLVEVDHAFLAGLKYLLIGGERLSTRHVNLVREKSPGWY